MPMLPPARHCHHVYLQFIYHVHQLLSQYYASRHDDDPHVGIRTAHTYHLHPISHVQLIVLARLACPLLCM